MTIINIKNMSFEYSKSQRIFNDINLKLTSTADKKTEGTVYIMMGTSGCGKSTLLKLFAQIEKPQYGTINISPKDSLLSYLPQENVIFEHLSREHNAKYYNSIQKLKPYFSEDTYKHLEKYLRLEDLINNHSSVLSMSGGEQQRLTLLRALSIEPKILLLDEPCTGLDISVKLNFLNLLRRVTNELGLLVVYVTHHIHEAKHISDKIIYIKTEGEQYAKTILSSVDEFCKNPPSLEAAMMVNGLSLNHLPFTISDNKIIINEHYTLGNISTSSETMHKKGIISFLGNVINYNNAKGIPVEVIGESNENIFMKFLDNSTSDQIITGPKANIIPKRIIISGSAHLYDNEGMNPQQFIVE